jgi:3-phenylpropionate/trans-cinnamate dioxygenase ferredoxin reductase component
MVQQNPIVVVGGGPAGASAVRVFAASGAPVTLITDEPDLPYDRTWLSKQVLLDPKSRPPALLVKEQLRPGKVLVRTGLQVTAFSPSKRTAILDSGEQIGFHKLLLATGAAPRRLQLPGAEGVGVHYLRNRSDADLLSAELAAPRGLVVIGGGVIGLEVAAAAKARGQDVDVVEAAPQILARGIPVLVAEWLARLHRQHGVRIRTGVLPVEIMRSASGHVTGVRLDNGTYLPAGLVVVGIGVSPQDHIAQAAGLAVADGVLVDAAGRTGDPNIFAAGDVVRMRLPGALGQGVRLESYQAAARQGEIAARVMLGEDKVFSDIPWQWSDQYDATLQVAGLFDPRDQLLACGEHDEGPLLILGIRAGKLVAACGVSRGFAVARPIRAAQHLIAAGGKIRLSAVEASAHHLGALTNLFQEAAAAREP